jgi:hypothetical protein
MKDDKSRSSVTKTGSRRREPLEVRVTLRYRFGDEPDDTVTVMDDRAVPMVNSVFKSRDLILRGLASTLFRAGMSSPRVAAELVPGLSLVNALKGEKKDRKKKARR